MIRPATKSDIAAFYGVPRVPLKMVALVDGDECLGVAGVAWCDDGVFALSSLAPARSSTAVVDLAIAAVALIEEVDGPVYATADPEEPTADKCLRYLGFEHDGERYVYRKPGRFHERNKARGASCGR